MQPKEYTVFQISGEYAYLRECGKGKESEVFIALALLPEGCDVGTRLHYECFSYTVVN